MVTFPSVEFMNTVSSTQTNHSGTTWGKPVGVAVARRMVRRADRKTSSVGMGFIVWLRRTGAGA